MHKHIVPALAALSLACASVPAAAEERSVSVPYGDLDLTSPTGLATLEGRIETAISRLCGRPEVRNVFTGAAHKRCVSEASHSARVQIARAVGKSRQLALNLRR